MFSGRWGQLGLRIEGELGFFDGSRRIFNLTTNAHADSEYFYKLFVDSSAMNENNIVETAGYSSLLF
jgi:hypothetical protein